MKTKTWHVVTTSAKHWTQQQPTHVYQQSLASLTSIRSHLPTTSTPPNNTEDNNKNTTTHNKRNLNYHPIYKQPSNNNNTTAIRTCRSFSTSSIKSSASTKSLQTASPAFQLPEEQPIIHHNHHKSLPLLDFFSKSYAKPVPSYTFTHGASGFAKNRHRYTTPDNKTSIVNSNSENYYSIQIGEDAYFRRSDSLGIADGVGGFADTEGKNITNNSSDNN